MKRALVIAALFIAFVAAAPKKKTTLPPLGTKFHALPDGKGKQLVEASCLPCHSPDILVQQRLTEKQWTANVEKMMRWGAAVRDDDKGAIIAYLAGHFGPENKFTPIATRPVGH
ncbi:MAG TPA: cytochrome c [Thermoanaerobaculia bacterium]|nr:cytochrome c [Thermoanaerobaculia bacterium]